jgi:hypothetical protein
MNGFHVKSVAKDEPNLLIAAQIGEPILSEHALGADDQVVTELLDGAQEVVRLGPNVPMQELVTFLVENAQVHPLRMQIHAAIVAMLIVVESHHDPPC